MAVLFSKRKNMYTIKNESRQTGQLYGTSEKQKLRADIHKYFKTRH